MEKFLVRRQFISPPRENDEPDVMEITAENEADASQHGFHMTEGKNGSYMVQKCPST